MTGENPSLSKVAPGRAQSQPASQSFVFDPPLPTLWSKGGPSPEQLANSVEGEEAQRIYDAALQDFELGSPNSVPRHEYGRTGLSMPLLSLGGFVSIGVTVMRNRKLGSPARCGCCKGLIFLVANGILIPLLLAISGPIVALASTSPSSSPIGFTGLCLGGLALAVVWTTISMALLQSEHNAHIAAMMAFAHRLGIDHVETARHYMESEAQLRPILAAARARGEKWIVQTKIRPYAQSKALYETACASLRTLGVERVQLLTIHGVNIPAHVDAVFEHSLEEVQTLKRDGKCDLVGLATHAHTRDILRIVESGKLDYINLHFGFFSSYTNCDNQAAVLAAAKRGLGIYAISPSNQGGELHKPPPKLVKLCAPLHPLEFGLLYLMTHRGIGDGGSVSFGPTDTSQFNFQLRALRLLPVAERLLPPIVQRLRDAIRAELGEGYCDGLNTTAGEFTQGDARMPGHLNLSLLATTHALWRAFDMESYMLRMAKNLAWPGDWCAGGGLEVLRGKGEDSEEVQQFRAALDKLGSPSGSPNADELLASLREMEKLVKPEKKGGLGKRIAGNVFAYAKWWIVRAAALDGKGCHDGSMVMKSWAAGEGEGTPEELGDAVFGLVARGGKLWAC